MNSLGLALLWGLFVYMVHLAATKGGLILSGSLRDLTFLTSLLAFSFLRHPDRRFFGPDSWSAGFPRLNPHSIFLAMPIAAAPMMISLVLGPLPAILFALVQGFLAILFWEGDPELALYFAIAGLWASQASRILPQPLGPDPAGTYSGSD